MGLLKLLFFPFVFLGRLIVGVIQFVLIAHFLITVVSLLFLAAVAILFFKGDTEILRRCLNLFVVHRGG